MYAFAIVSIGRTDLPLPICACVAERPLDQDPAQYMLPLELMMENDYPIPSYMADVFEKPPGWIETPQPSQKTRLSQLSEKPETKIYAIDCEMVRVVSIKFDRLKHLATKLVLDRRRKGACQSVCR